MPVALLAEGVDRNVIVRHEFQQIGRVALLAEGVDRNYDRVINCGAYNVALLAEGVDRNYSDNLAEDVRRGVALLAEGVDRNLLCAVESILCAGRPPRGGRG